MSADTHGHEHGHDHGDVHGGADHGSLKSYVIGFLLSVVLTAIPFWLVMTATLPAQTTGFIIMAFAVAQIVVHMIFFLHMNPRSDNGWTMMAMIFTIVIVVITLSGSLWVMYHLNTNMMPTMHDMSEMP